MKKPAETGGREIAAHSLFLSPDPPVPSQPARSENEFLVTGLADKEKEEALGTRMFVNFSFCLPLHPHKLRASNRLISFYHQNLILCKKISYFPVSSVPFVLPFLSFWL